jgi:chromosome segregation ATPase
MEIKAGNQALAERTDLQSENLEKTVYAMQQVTDMAATSANASQQGAQVAQQTAASSELSHAAVLQVSAAMAQIKQHSQRMDDITQTIEAVAFQTNLLALNAAVEAARAGTFGRGFAVVAAEVRALAQRAGKAAKEIRTLISESSQRIEVGHSQVSDATARMNDALANAQSVNAMLSNIRAAASAQQSGIGQVNEAVLDIDLTTQQNAAMVEELAAAAAGLEAQIGVITDSMRMFRLAANDRPVADIDAVALRRQAKEAQSQNTSVLDPSEAIAKHLQWKTKLRNAALHNETLDVEAISCDDRCAVGKWLYGSANAQWGGQPRFVDLLNRHREFHQEAGRIAQTVVDGNPQAGLSMMEAGTPFALATQAVVMALKRWSTTGPTYP